MLKNWKSLLPIVTFVAFCLSSSVYTAAAAPPQTITVLMSSPTPDTFYANMSSVPEKLGYFAAEGLNVNFANVPGGASAAQIVAGGKADMYFGTSDAVFKSHQVGGNLKIVYVMNDNLQYYPVVQVDSPIKTMADLKGKKLGVLSLSMGGIPYYRAMLAAAGLDPDKDVTFVAVGQGAAAIAALRSGAVDALGEWDAEYAAEENAGMRYRKLLPPNFNRDVNNIITSSIVTTDSFIRSHPEAIRGYLRAVAKATVFCLHNEAACVKIHWNAYPAIKPADPDSPVVLRNAVHVLDSRYAFYDFHRFQGIRRWGDTTDQRIENTAALLKKNGELGTIGPASEYFDRRFLGYANAFNGTAIIREAENYKV